MSAATMVMCIALLGMALQLGAAVIPSDSQYVQSLDGTWRFKLENTTNEEQFYALDYKEDISWHDLAVPGNWEIAGFSPATYGGPDDASGFYRKWITIPADWKGREVRINFDGVMCGTEIWLNGQPVNVSEPAWGRANYHEGGWTAWQADLTPQAKFGEKNLLALRVTKNTKSSDLDACDSFFLGGIERTVTLFSVPQTHIEDITVQTFLRGGNGEVKTLVAVAGEGKVLVKLGREKPVEAAVSGGKAEFSQIVSKPRLWTAEHPNLYPLKVELKDSSGKVIEKIEKRIGIREITIEDGVMMVNGVPIKMSGVCRHDIYPSMGTAVDESVWRKDLTLMKENNINAVRTSHYPYGSEFYDLCDEMGFYVADELPFAAPCPTDDPEMAPAFLSRARETIARDKNHPCVVIWAIGNENKPGSNLQLAADLVKQLDSTRPRLVSWLPADMYGTEIDDLHYTSPAKIRATGEDKARRAKFPQAYLENPNVWDVRLGADYGSLDLWAAVLQRTMDAVWEYDTIPGSFLWEWQDRAVCDKCPVKLYHFDPATGVQYVKIKGLVDGWRHPRPDLYHVKMIYSPIKIDGDIDLASKPGSAVLDITNRYSFTDLTELNVVWTAVGSGKSGTVHPKLAPRTSGKIEIKLPDDWTTKTPSALRIDFNHPGGWNVITCQVPLTTVNPPAISKTLPEGLKFPKLNLINNEIRSDKVLWRVIDRYPAHLENIKTDGSGDLMEDTKSMDADIVLKDKVVGKVHAEFADGLFKYRIDWTGDKTDIQELGWTFEMPKSTDHFSWHRKALYSYYPETHIGRPQGTATPDSADVHITDITRPDAFDFNSTKYHCDWATLTDKAGHGLRIDFDPGDRHQVKGGIAPDGHQLVVNKQCSPPRDYSSGVVSDFFLTLEAGDSVEGSFYVRSQ
jgi:beta-galactosidase